MSDTKKRKAPKTKVSKDIEQLQSAVNLMKGAEHNPVDWAAVIKFVAPIVARIAARYTARYVATKLKKRLSPKTATEIADLAAEQVQSSVAKIKLPKTGK